MKNLRRLLRSTKSGMIEITTGVFFITILAIILIFAINIYKFKAISVYLDNAIHMSCLGAALPDIKTYGKTNEVVFTDGANVRATFEKLLQENMEKSLNANLFSDVEIEKFILANKTSSGMKYVEVLDSSMVREITPDDLNLDETSIVTNLKFRVKVIGDLYLDCNKAKTVDVVIIDED